MRSLRAALFVGGIAILALLVAWLGAGALMSALTRLTWWQLVLVCLPFGLIMAVDTLGWRYAFAATPPSYLRLLAARMAGEAVNIVTALGSVGGEAVKVWLLRPAISYEESVPSVVIAKTTSTLAQVLFLTLGLILAEATVTINGQIVSAMLGLVTLEILLVGGFLGTQLSGLVRKAGGSSSGEASSRRPPMRSGSTPTCAASTVIDGRDFCSQWGSILAAGCSACSRPWSSCGCWTFPSTSARPR